MALLSVIIAPDPRLKAVCEPVESVDGKIAGFMNDMLETMYKSNGVGLAAPQVGVARRIIVTDVSRENESPNPVKMVNPEIVWSSEEEAFVEEGCLSFPDQYAEVTRPESVRVRYIDHENEIRELAASGFLARCIQHEMDHLEGVLFVDYISSLKRGMILRKLAKIKRRREDPA
ncbi:MAG TPA: peptide deformylase [Alphaproteobacteria bacterium]|nr:peptide deformylase [Alphaproteobacteria bacterium]